MVVRFILDSVRLHLFGPRYPDELNVEVTNRCNLACRMCETPRLPASMKQDMEMETFMLLGPPLRRASTIFLYGNGEPLLARRFPSFLAKTRQWNPRAFINFNTNGLLLPRFMDLLIRDRVNRVCVSIDGALSATYDSIRTGSSFVQLERAVTTAVQANRQAGAPITFTIEFVAMRSNIEDLADLVRFAHRMDIREITVVHLISQWPDLQGEKLSHFPELADAKMRKAREVAESLDVNLILPRLFSEPPMPHQMASFLGHRLYCISPFRFAFIRSDGSLYPCCSGYRSPAGSIQARGFWSVWDGSELRAVREEIKAGRVHPKCQGCFWPELYNRPLR